MTRTSGPNRERIVRNGIFLLMCVGMGGWFAYDGWIGYLDENQEVNRELLPVEIRDKANASRVYPNANSNVVREVVEKTKNAPFDEQRSKLESLLGGPPTLEAGGSLYYFAQDGILKVGERGERVFFGDEPFLTSEKHHTLTSILTQKLFGVAVGLVGLYMLVFLWRVVSRRAEVSDAGLTLNGGKPIPFESMKSLDDSEFRKKGRIYLECEGTTPPRVLLDEYHFAEFDQIIAAICEKTGFNDPVALEKAEKAANAGRAADADQ